MELIGFALDHTILVVIVYDVVRGRYGVKERMRENAVALMCIWICRPRALGFPRHGQALSSIKRHEERPVSPNGSLSCTVSQFSIEHLGNFLWRSILCLNQYTACGNLGMN